MNVKAIRYGRIKRQAPEPKIRITKEHVTQVLERLTAKSEPAPSKPLPGKMEEALRAWNARH